MPRGILEVAIVLPAVVSGEVPCPLGSAQREFGEQLFEDLAVFFGDGFGGLAGPGVFLGVDAPLAVVVFEGGAVFDPVPTVQVADAPFAGLDDAVAGLVDVATDHEVVTVGDRDACGSFLELVDVFDGALDALLDLFGQGNALAAQRQ